MTRDRASLLEHLTERHADWNLRAASALVEVVDLASQDATPVDELHATTALLAHLVGHAEAASRAKSFLQGGGLVADLVSHLDQHVPSSLSPRADGYRSEMFDLQRTIREEPLGALPAQRSAQ